MTFYCMLVVFELNMLNKYCRRTGFMGFELVYCHVASSRAQKNRANNKVNDKTVTELAKFCASQINYLLVPSASGK